MARQARQVIGIEGSEQMVERAGENAAFNSLENTAFFALNLDQDLSDLKADESSWINTPFNKMLIDPPRSGAKEIAERIDLFGEIETLVYVSCNPATLARDAAILVEKGFELKGAGVMDMFPHTNHVESLALFKKR